MMAEDTGWWNHPNLAFPITGKQHAALLDMIASPGWKVFSELKKSEQGSAVALGMNPNTPEEVRAPQRGVWYACTDILNFDTTVREVEQMSKEDARHALDQEGA